MQCQFSVRSTEQFGVHFRNTHIGCIKLLTGRGLKRLPQSRQNSSEMSQSRVRFLQKCVQSPVLFQLPVNMDETTSTSAITSASVTSEASTSASRAAPPTAAAATALKTAWENRWPAPRRERSECFHTPASSAKTKLSALNTVSWREECWGAIYAILLC